MSACACGRHIGRINGRTLKENLKNKSGHHPFAQIDKKAWIEICPSCHQQWLSIDEHNSLPFLDSGGLMRTAADEARPSQVIDFANFQFTHAALRSGMALQLLEFQTRQMEERGALLPLVLSDLQAADFCEGVCRWGGGARVWGKLNANNGAQLGAVIARWLNAVQAGNITDEDAINRGIAISGLGVSFASKHLRMLQPERFVVLDEVLSDGFGFALNKKGYALFLRELKKLQDDLKERFRHSCSIATLEAGLFMLVRQGVRARSELATVV